MSYVKRNGIIDTVYEDEDWAELVSPSQRVVGPVSHRGDKDHRNLTHRDAPEQHPIEAIAGLVEALASKVSSDSVKAERTSEGTLLTIGDATVMIYDGDDGIKSITINGKPLPVYGDSVNINTAEIDVSDSIITIEGEHSSTTTTVSRIVSLILQEISDMKEKVNDIPEIVFRTWPGMQEGI